jgi:hypothetical protein
VEVTFSEFGERGSIDIVGRHQASGMIAVIEVKGSISDVNQTIIGLDQKRRLMPEIARKRGWACRGTAAILVVADSSTARDRVGRHRATFDAAYPLRGPAVAGWLRNPVPPAPNGLIYLRLRNARPMGADRQRVYRGGSSTHGSRSRTPDAAERPRQGQSGSAG